MTRSSGAIGAGNNRLEGQGARRGLLTRRGMLQMGCAAAWTAGMGTKLFAAPSSGPRFLLVFLRGGYDCANLLVPHSSSYYYEVRPRIAVPAPAASGAMSLDADWALAPAVCKSIGPLYSKGQVAFIPFAGTEDLSRSHFHTQDTIELGAQGAAAKRDYRSGFLARLSAVLTGCAPVSFTGGLPLSFKGRSDIPNLELEGPGQHALDEDQVQQLTAMYAQSPLGRAVTDGLELRQEMAREMPTADQGAGGPIGLEVKAARMAQLMRERYRLGFVDVGGWDTHVNQGGAQGNLANSLHTLGQGLQTFAEGMGPQWKDTVVVVVSEFGRTLRENGNGGTDHGHGSAYWVLGGGINGGRIVGEQVRVAADTLFQDRDFPVLNDYRRVLGGLFRRLWGLSDAQLGRVFPDEVPRDLQLI